MIYTGLFKRLVYAAAFKRLEMQLERGEIDGETMRSSALKPIKLFEICQQVPITAWLHAKHATFAPELAATLKQMESEGLVGKHPLETAIRLPWP